MFLLIPTSRRYTPPYGIATHGSIWSIRTVSPGHGRRENPDPVRCRPSPCELLQREPNGLPLIVKIDIEGGEIELFRSNVEWIEQTPLIVFELHDWQGGSRGAGHSVFSRLSTHPRDYMLRADNMFSFAHSLAQIN
jgi:hypothetical protein